MARVDIPPTKSNLRKIKNDLVFAYEGFDLLDQKREILVAEIMKNINKIKTIEEKVSTNLDELFTDFKITAMEMGSDITILKSNSEKEVYDLTMDTTRFMGMEIPVFKILSREALINSGLQGTTAMYDVTKIKCMNFLMLLADYATVMKTIYVLSRELKKVQRKVNALEKIFIPRNEEARKFISDRLEEMEREEIFIKKLVKQGLEG